MSVFPILLRALLCIGLILNGSGAATAATLMQIEHATAMAATKTQSVASAGVAMAAPRQDDPAVAMHAMHAMHSTDTGSVAADQASGADGTPHSPDCCKTSACSCDCIQPVQAPITMLVLDDPMVVRSTVVQSMKTGYPEPAIARLIRPPIS